MNNAENQIQDKTQMKEEISEHRLTIMNNTLAEDIDIFFTNMWKSKHKTHLIIDTSNCENITLKRALSLKYVINKHRKNSIKYIDHSTVIVKSKLTSAVVKTALFLFRTTRPVKVECKLNI